MASGRKTPADLSSGMAIKTLEGGTVMPGKMGSTYEVNNAHVVCGNVQTANATVYIIDTVLMPSPDDDGKPRSVRKKDFNCPERTVAHCLS